MVILGSREHHLLRPGDGQVGVRAIRAWAERHYGLITRAELRALGATDDWIDGRLADGWLVPAARGVFYVGHRSGAPGQAEALALAVAGPQYALGGQSATAWRAITDRPAGPVQLVGPRSRSAGRRGGILLPGDVQVVDGLRCATPARAVMDLPPAQLRQALQWLMKRGIDLEPIVERMHGRRGAKRFRLEVAQLVPAMAHTMSELEDRFLRLCLHYGIPVPVLNGVRAGRDLLDCCWSQARLVVELDGRRWHEHRDREDRARDRRRTVEGMRTLRYDWWDVTRDEAATAAEVLEALGVSRGPASPSQRR